MIKKKILEVLFAGVIGTAVLGVSAMAAGDMNEDTANAVASIGDEYYSTVALAMADAQANNTIVIHKEIDNIFALTAPSVAPLTFKAATPGIEITGRALLPKTEIKGTVTYDGFDFTGNSDWVVYQWDNGDEQLANLELVYKNCDFGSKGICIGWVAGRDNWNLKKLTLDNCTAYDAKEVFSLQYVSEVEIINCDFSNVTDRLINVSAASGDVTVSNSNFGSGSIQLSQNVGNEVRNLTIENSTFTGEKAVVIHENFTNNGTDFGTVEFVNNTVEETTELVNFKDTEVVASEYIESNVQSVIAVGNKTTDGEAVTEISNGYTPAAPVAMVGGVYYTDLAEAVAKADVNAEIDLLGNTVDLPEVNSLKITKDLTIKNGTIDITNGTWNGNSVIEVYGGTSDDFVVATFNNVDFVGDNYSSAFGVIYVYEYGKAIINGCDFKLSNEKYSAGGVLKGNGVAMSAFDVTDSTFDLENPNRIIANATVALDNVTINAVVTDDTLVVGETNNHAFRNLVGTVNNSRISADGFETGIKNTDGDLAVTGNSSIVLTNSKDTDLVVGAGRSVDVDATSELVADTSDIASDANVSDNVVVKAEIIYVQFKKTDLDEEGEDNNELKDVYQLVLAGYNAETINELASADLTFKFVPTPVNGGAMDYAVIGATGVTVTQLGDTDRFMFNYDGIAKYEETGKAIVIATVEVSGYGSYYFGTDATVDTNAVYATEIRDNIVDGFVPAADTLVLNRDMVEDDGMVGEIDGEQILVPTRELTINIDFPNEAATDNTVAYQQMTVTVSGGDLEEALVIKLGDKAEITDLAKFAAKTSEDKDVSADASANAYDITITDLLTLNVAYNVEVAGAGYRTARYTVTMTEDKTLNFWNNVKDNAIEVEEGKDSSAKNVTFLAGDIVKDNDINIYDLSAVVSYFGEEGLGVDNRPEYAKYDLNRDGKIDSKDVAYVLVSWGN